MDDEDDGEYTTIEGLPDLETESNRDEWAEFFAAQDDETLKANEMTWIKCLAVYDEDRNMVVRFVYDDGSEEIFDCEIRRKLIAVGPPQDMN